MEPVPRRWARYYLANAPSLATLVAGNAVLLLVGLRFYVDRGLGAVPTLLWPLFTDSPTATFLMALSLATLLPNLGRAPWTAPRNRALSYLHTLAFLWLVKYGLWTAVALSLRPGLYLTTPLEYAVLVAGHLGFVAEALLIPHYADTTRGALGIGGALLVFNDALDYGFLVGLGTAYHPPLRYEPGVALAAVTLALSAVAVLLAVRCLPRANRATDRRTTADDAG